ncbi:unnamed protein product [Effrenium voratum]|uniref:Uncharacterized protein n=1 Tax=Effrenium voratum TaxID=2562239 RepID=A0AA36IK79_9DINO|nr:unnamed protein product [Effrenium voratum]CAJ1387902.1 unnamed protein product [Effrenium voratum]CAJ1438558.1 unnamed protein product [Effrenium voratum]
MAKLTEALQEAATVALEDERGFASASGGVLTKLKRGLAEVKKSPEMLAEVPPDLEFWPFLLRVAEKASFAKQVWEASVVLLARPEWAASFAQQEQKQRLNLCKAGPRDVAVVTELVKKLLAGGVEAGDLLALEDVSGMDPALCGALLEPFEAAGAEAELLASLAQRSASEAEAKRRIVAPESKAAVGKDANLPVYVCEGISGSHQKMEIKKGL